MSQRLTVNARAAGPRLGKDVQLAIKGSKSGDWSVDADGTVTSGGLALVEGEYSLETVVAGDTADTGATAMLPSGGFVVLDTDVTSELATEGLARDLVRAVQQARRDTGLHVSDRISLTIQGGAEVFEATVTHRDLIVGETLADPVRRSRPRARPARRAAGHADRGGRRRQPCCDDPGGEAMITANREDELEGADVSATPERPPRAARGRPRRRRRARGGR